jgi:hypothetical protein
MKPLVFTLVFTMYVVLYLASFIWFTTNVWLHMEGYDYNFVFNIPVNAITVVTSLMSSIWFAAAVLLSWDMHFHKKHQH